MDLDAATAASPIVELQSTIQGLIDRCQILNDEVQTFISAVEANHKFAKTQNFVEGYRGLRGKIITELRFLNRLVVTEMPEQKARNYIASSNLLYYEALWDAAKRSSEVLGFHKYFFRNQKKNYRSQGLSAVKGGGIKGEGSALVDIVVADGSRWVRVSTISEKRLLFELAKLGWQNDSSDSDSDSMTDALPLNGEEDGDEDEVEIVKNARELARAALANRVRGRPPKVHFVLTRIIAGKLAEIDHVLRKIRDTGAVVQCANEIPDPPSFEAALPTLLVDPYRTISPTVNIDCNILIALTSDISHAQCPILDWYPRELKAQMKEEEKEKVLPAQLYPAIGSRSMVCTREAAEHMIRIVDTMATDTEKQRANLLLAQKDQEGSSPEILTQTWADISDHAIPEGFKLPIRVVPCDLGQTIGKLPAVASKVAAELTPLNANIFLFGWAEGLTTLSANRTTAKQIDNVINQNGLKDGETGPQIWLCGESRSLLAKHKRQSRGEELQSS